MLCRRSSSSVAIQIEPTHHHHLPSSSPAPFITMADHHCRRCRPKLNRELPLLLPLSPDHLSTCTITSRAPLQIKIQHHLPHLSTGAGISTHASPSSWRRSSLSRRRRCKPAAAPPHLSAQKDEKEETGRRREKNRRKLKRNRGKRGKENIKALGLLLTKVKAQAHQWPKYTLDTHFPQPNSIWAPKNPKFNLLWTP